MNYNKANQILGFVTQVIGVLTFLVNAILNGPLAKENTTGFLVIGTFMIIFGSMLTHQAYMRKKLMEIKELIEVNKK